MVNYTGNCYMYIIHRKHLHICHTGNRYITLLYICSANVHVSSGWRSNDTLAKHSEHRCGILQMTLKIYQECFPYNYLKVLHDIYHMSSRATGKSWRVMSPSTFKFPGMSHSKPCDIIHISHGLEGDIPEYQPRGDTKSLARYVTRCRRQRVT